MSDREIIEYNKMCIKFLPFKYLNGAKYWVIYKRADNSFFGKNKRYLAVNNLKFHSDWRWIMEVVNAIEKTYHDFHGFFGVHINSNSCTIQGTNLRLGPENPHYAYYNENYGEDKMEAVVQAINQFLIFYNNEREQLKRNATQ